MSNKTRKRMWPMALVMSIAIVGALAAFVVLVANPGSSSAHDNGVTGSAHCDDLPNNIAKGIAHDGADHDCDNPPTDTGNGGNGNGNGGNGNGETPTVATITSSSNSASAAIEIKVNIGSLAGNAQAGSSVVLYLEDDYQVPDTIDRDTVYFTVRNADGSSPGPNQNDGGRVYATDPIEIDDDDHFAGDDDWDIQVFIPDMNDAEDSGYNGPMAGQTLTLTFSKAAGIKNPSESHDSDNDYADVVEGEGGYKASYAVLGPDDSVPDAPSANTVENLDVHAKISLSDEDNDRGYELTVTGSGFNNGTSAAVHVLGDASIDPARLEDPAMERALCGEIINRGQRAGIATVDSDDTAAVTVEVAVPIFVPGANNYICMVDGEGRASVSDVEVFELQDSLRIVPAAANAGDTVNVFAQDFPTAGAALTELKIAGQVVWPASAAGDTYVPVTADSIGADGSATATFQLPGSISNSALEGTVRIDATWGTTSEDGKITVTGSALTLSKTEVSANESVTIRGSGFGDGSGCLVSATISGADLLVVSDDDATAPAGSNADCDIDGNNSVEVSSAGQFAATVAIWSQGGTNPALTPGVHTIEVVDDQGFTGSATIIIREPTLTVTPDVAGPRDYITISGENWPVENEDGGSIDDVEIVIDESGVNDDEDADPDASGRWSVDYRVDAGVTIPSTVQVKATYGTTSEIVRIGSFSVPAANLTVEPTRAVPGDTITLSATGFSLFESDIEVKIGNLTVNVPASAHTDSDGAIDGLEVLVPSLDPALYTVQMNVGDTVTIGELTVMDDTAVGVPQQLPDAVSAIGDNLEAVFYFNDATKSWQVFDPRPEWADLNTLEELVSGQAYWILVKETQDDVVLNGRLRSLTCSGDNCWNLEVW